MENGIPLHQIQCYNGPEIVSFLKIEPSFANVRLDEVYHQMIPPNSYDELFTLTVTTGDAHIYDETAKMCQGNQIGYPMEFSSYRGPASEQKLYDHRHVSGISLLPWEDNYIGPHEIVDQGGAIQQVKVTTIFKPLQIMLLSYEFLPIFNIFTL